MKKIDGLRIDYLSGDADVRLPNEFLGQAHEFQMIAIGFWLARLENERDKVAEAISKHKRSTLGLAFKSVTLDGLLETGNSIVYMSKPESESGKRLLATFKCEDATKNLAIWESVGRLSFMKVTDVPQSSPTMKSLLRSAKRAHGAWSQVQKSMRRIGAARIIEGTLVTEQTPHQMASEILRITQSKRVSATH